MNKNHIKKGDFVKIIAGENKGIIGKISTIIKKKNFIFLENLSPRIKYEKKNGKKESNKIELPIPIHFSNVMLWDNEAKKASRIGYKLLENKKIRYFKKSGNIV